MTMIKCVPLDDELISLKERKGIANYISRIMLDKQVLNGYGYEMLKRDDKEEK